MDDAVVKYTTLRYKKVGGIILNCRKQFDYEDFEVSKKQLYYAISFSYLQF